jgi:hypothetical protein
MNPRTAQPTHSFATDSEVDREVKRGLIMQTLSVVQAQPSDRRYVPPITIG